METLKKGTLAGLKTTWTLGKIIFPVTLIITLLSHTPVLDWLISVLSPAMKWIGLPGEAAIPLVLGNFLNLYAGIGGILTLDSLTVQDVFILAVMLSFSHNLFIESGVAASVGIKLWVILLVRIGLALFSAFMINLLWDGGTEKAQYGFISKPEAAPNGWGEITLTALEKASLGILQLALIVIPLMIIMQYMKDKGWLNKFSNWMAPAMKLLGMKENTSMTMAAGLTIGLAYGAGVMMQAAKEDGVSKKDLYLAFIFLVSCHAVVEDTLVFVPLGIPVLPLLIIRVVTAIVLTVVVAYFWNRMERKNSLTREELQHETRHHTI
ncbi:nucleoside recognition domain-containing protein [Fictibacillus sp. b24]|uniref:nucleoside recognition domain-containing protein n=1 Tax=Fictibacillus sp. b24 TaxID=3055863 RepID=UPI0025A0E8A4|nr:nucleoside recognition domain-containing protein [Fictibacillus sp. b24]MDM5315188.1 nucleoside recognition domain-containing protein [Fictibacillus sp. b24]